MKEVVEYYELNLRNYINIHQQEERENIITDAEFENNILIIKKEIFNDINENLVQINYYNKSEYNHLRGTKS
jgi:hypothetical protein